VLLHLALYAKRFNGRGLLGGGAPNFVGWFEFPRGQKVYEKNLYR
jgi:hypothetical protein